MTVPVPQGFNNRNSYKDHVLFDVLSSNICSRYFPIIVGK